LKTRETNSQAVKKINKIAGFEFSTLSVKIGNIITIREAQIQFVAVVNGTISGWTISGMYNHTIGPRDTPKIPININNPTRTSASPIELSSDPLFKKNPIPTNKQLTP
jgi:hypothetical protein